MTLPYLKHEQEAGSAAMDSEDADYSMLDAIVEDFLACIKRPDKSTMKAALQALIEHMQEADQKQDSETMEKD